MKVASYKKESDITYSLGATNTMEYLNVRPDLLEGVILHPKFDSEDTIAKINTICGSRGIPVETSEKPFNILSKKGNCFVIGVIRKETEKIAASIPGSKLRILPGEGHGSYIVHNTKIAEIILEETAEE